MQLDEELFLPGNKAPNTKIGASMPAAATAPPSSEMIRQQEAPASRQPPLLRLQDRRRNLDDRYR